MITEEKRNELINTLRTNDRSKFSEALVVAYESIDYLKSQIKNLVEKKKPDSFYSTVYQTVGGAALEVIPVAGAREGMVIQVSPHTLGAGPVSIVRAFCQTDAVHVEFSGDPSTDHKVNVTIFLNKG